MWLYHHPLEPSVHPGAHSWYRTLLSMKISSHHDRIILNNGFKKKIHRGAGPGGTGLGSQLLKRLRREVLRFKTSLGYGSQLLSQPPASQLTTPSWFTMFSGCPGVTMVQTQPVLAGSSIWLPRYLWSFSIARIPKMSLLWLRAFSQPILVFTFLTKQKKSNSPCSGASPREW